MQLIYQIAESVRGSQGTVTVPLEAAKELGLKVQQKTPGGAAVVSCRQLVEKADAHRERQLRRRAEEQKAEQDKTKPSAKQES